MGWFLSVLVIQLERYRLAAEQRGGAAAQNRVDAMYEFNWGVPQDYVQNYFAGTTESQVLSR